MSFPNNFKFTFIFSVFLVAVLAFVGRPAMATVSVTAQVTEVVGASTGPPAVQGKKVVTIKYSENADPEPTLDDFTIDGTQKLIDAVAADADTLSVSMTGSGDTFKLTFLGPVNGSVLPTIPSLKLPGYVMNDTLEGESANVDSAPVTKFLLEVNTLGGKGYAIIANYTNEDNTPNNLSNLANDPAEYPQLPVLDVPDKILRSAWSNHSNEPMPNLRNLFKRHPGGTINLRLQIVRVLKWVMHAML